MQGMKRPQKATILPFPTDSIAGDGFTPLKLGGDLGSQFPFARPRGGREQTTPEGISHGR